MAYNTKAIKTDVNQKPIPQYYSPVTDDYEVLQGANGAARHILYGADGNPITTSGNKLAVRATEIETMLTAIEGYIDGLEPAIGTPAADPAANTILARLKTLATLIGEVQATPTANTLLFRVKSLEDKLGEVQAIPTANTLLARIKSIEDKLTAGIQLSGSTITDTQPVPVKNIIKTLVTTLVNAQSVAAGGKINPTPMGIDGTEDKVYILVNVDKQPWGITARNMTGNLGSDNLYPQKYNFATAYTTATLPSIQLYLGDAIDASPTTFIEARNSIFPYFSAATYEFYNQSAEIATVTIKTVRVWGGK